MFTSLPRIPFHVNSLPSCFWDNWELYFSTHTTLYGISSHLTSMRAVILSDAITIISLVTSTGPMSHIFVASTHNGVCKNYWKSVIFCFIRRKPIKLNGCAPFLGVYNWNGKRKLHSLPLSARSQKPLTVLSFL